MLLVMVTITASVPARGVWWCEEDQETRTTCCCVSVSLTLGDAASTPTIQPQCCELINPTGSAFLAVNEAKPRLAFTGIARHSAGVEQGAASETAWHQTPQRTAVRGGRMARPLYVWYCSRQT